MTRCSVSMPSQFEGLCICMFLYRLASIFVWFKTMENLFQSTDSFSSYVTDNA